MVRYWVVRMVLKPNDDKYSKDWEIAENNSFVGIGWADMGNLTKFSEEEKEKLIEEIKTYDFSKKPSWDASQILTFVHKIEIGDIVILPTYPENIDDIVYKIGKIKSRACYKETTDDGAQVKIRRDVEWVTSVPKEKLSDKLKSSLISQNVAYSIDKHKREIEALMSGNIFI